MTRLSNETFKTVIKHTPLVSIDFLLKKENKYLLGKRKNPPAKDFYFTIGSRIFKNETIAEAQKRILKEELNIILNVSKNIKFSGIFEHFYKDSIFGNTISTHYVNLLFLLNYDELALKNIDSLPLEQHSNYKWFTKEEILKDKTVHEYVKEYFKGSRYV